MRYAAAIKALRVTIAVGVTLSIYAAFAHYMLRFEDYMNPPRVIPEWVRLSVFFSRIWWIGGWVIVSVPVFLITMVWSNERLRQRDKQQIAEAAKGQS